LKDFVRLLDQNPYVKQVELSNYGELFLNPELTGILRAARKRGVRLLADNGTNLNSAEEEQLAALIRYRLFSLTCSLDGTTQETYRRYRVGGQFEQVIQNIRLINHYKSLAHSPYPFLTWQFIVFGHNEHEIPQARRMARELNMRFRLKLSWNEKLSPIQNPDRIRRMLGYASRSEYHRTTGLELGHGICRMLWEEPQINWDGRVLGCARNFWGEFGGNVFREGLLEAVNSESMQAAREMLSGRTVSEADIPCVTCSIYRDRLMTGQFVKYGPLTKSFRRVVRWVTPIRRFFRLG